MDICHLVERDQGRQREGKVERERERREIGKRGKVFFLSRQANRHKFGQERMGEKGKEM